MASIETASLAGGSSAHARLFLALWPQAAALSDTLAFRSSMSWPAAARPTPPDKLHVTLHFIGDVARERLPEVVAGLPTAPRAVDLIFDRFEVWPGGIAVLTASRVLSALAVLHAETAKALRRLALPVDTREYRPHVTLARRAELANRPTPYPLHAPVRWHSDGYALVESAEGRYRILSRHGQAKGTSCG